MIPEDICKYTNKNIFIMQPIKNTMINQGLFHKLLYSNHIFTSNGLYININFMNTKWINGRLYYDISTNSDLLNRVAEIEKYILEKVSICKKYHYKIYDQIKNGNLKKNNANSNIVLKISGVWENDNSIGISFKIISINNIITLQ